VNGGQGISIEGIIAAVHRTTVEEAAGIDLVETISQSTDVTEMISIVTETGNIISMTEIQERGIKIKAINKNIEMKKMRVRQMNNKKIRY
jgi:hypothetical protein